MHSRYVACISVVFHADDRPVAEWIRARRLVRCRATSPIPRGLLSAAHLSRSFRAAYGVPPAEYRVRG